MKSEAISRVWCSRAYARRARSPRSSSTRWGWRSEEHTSELQSRLHLVCRLLLEKKKHPYPIFLLLIVIAIPTFYPALMAAAPLFFAGVCAQLRTLTYTVTLLAILQALLLVIARS